jgi:nicotinamidase-related amidase
VPGQKLKQDYSAAGFNRKLGFGRAPALVIVDFVGAYLIKGSPLYAGVETARDNAAALLAAARRAAIPIAHTRVAYAADGADGGIFFRKVAALKVFTDGADPALQAFDPALEPRPGETVIVKQYASAFFGTSLASTLRVAGVDTVLIAGVSTSGCIRATALDACQNGFVPVVVADAVGDRHRKIHEANLFDLDAKYADVESLSKTCQYLRKWKRTNTG